MKKYSIILTVLLMAALDSFGQTPRNCSQILAVNSAAATGVYTIDPDDTGPLPSMECYCDMTTDGGGWTLILNYNHLTASNPLLKIRTDSLPLQDNTTLGFDESNSESWGHAGNNLLNAIPFDELRWYGITSEHSRILHFKTNHAGTISYFKTGIGSTTGISTSFTAMADHTAFLPAALDFSVFDRGDLAMTDYPLWRGSTYHWYLGGADPFCSSTRWELDDYPCSTEPSTFNQIWVRQNGITGLNNPINNELDIRVSPNPADNFVNINFLNNVNSTLTMYNSIGQLVYTELLFNETNQIDISAFENGIYTLVVTSKEGKQHQKLIIQR